MIDQGQCVAQAQRDELVRVGCVGEPGLDGADQRLYPAGPVALEQRLRRRQDGAVGLAREIALGAPVDVAGEHQGEAGEERCVANRQPQDRRPDREGARHAADQGSGRRL